MSINTIVVIIMTINGIGIKYLNTTNFSKCVILFQFFRSYGDQHGLCVYLVVVKSFINLE